MVMLIIDCFRIFFRHMTAGSNFFDQILHVIYTTVL